MWRNFGMKFCGMGKREKSREKPTQTPFRPPRNAHGGTETRTRDPSGGRRAPNRLRHEAAKLSYYLPEFYDFYVLYNLDSEIGEHSKFQINSYISF